MTKKMTMNNEIIMKIIMKNEDNEIMWRWWKMNENNK